MEELVESVIQAYFEDDLKKAQKLIDENLNNLNLEDKIEFADFLNENSAYELGLKIVQTIPNQDEALLIGAESRFGLNENDLAIEMLSSIDKKSDNYLRALLLRADLYQSEGQDNIAENLLLEAQTLSDDPVVRFALAEFYYFTDNFQKAILIYESILKNKDSEVAGVDLKQRIAQSLFSAGDFINAIDYFEQVDSNKLSEDDLITLANAYLTIDDDQNAKRILDILENQSMISSDYYLILSKYYQKQNDLQDAISALYKGVYNDDFNSQLKIELTNLLILDGQNDRAKEIALKVLEKDPDNFDAVDVAVRLLNSDGDYDSSLALLDKENSLKNDDSRFNWLIAKTQYLLDDYQEAKKNIDIAYDNLNENPDFLLDAIEIYKNFNLDKLKEAIEDYLKINPDDIDINALKNSYEN